MLGAALGCFNLHLLAGVRDTVAAPATFASVSEAALPGVGARLTDVALVCNGIGACISYQIVVTDSLVRVTGVGQRQLWTFSTLVVLVPLTLLKSLDMLKFTSLLSLIACILIAAMIVFFAFAGRTELGSGDSGDGLLDVCHGYAVGSTCSDYAAGTSCPGPVVSIGTPLHVLKAFSTFVNAYGCQQLILPIVEELARPTRSRMLGVIFVSMGIVVVIYLSTAVAGYQTFGSIVCADVLMSYPVEYPVEAARVLVSISVLAGYPLQAFVAKRSLASLFNPCWDRARRRRSVPQLASLDASLAPSPSVQAVGALPEGPGGEGEEDEELRWLPSFMERNPARLGFSVALLTLTTGVALVLSDLGIVISVVGATR